jgi:hypothetical protein
MTLVIVDVIQMMVELSCTARTTSKGPMMDTKEIIGWVWLILVPVLLGGIIFTLWRIRVGMRKSFHDLAEELKGWALAGREHARTAKETTEQLRDEVHHITQVASGSLPPGMGSGEHNMPTSNVRRTPTPDDPPPSAGTKGLALALAMLGMGSTALAIGWQDMARHLNKLPVDIVMSDVNNDLTSGLEAMRQREYRRAAESMELAASKGADPTLALGSAAECRFYLRQYPEALALCDRLNASVPNCGRAHTVRGLVMLKSGDELVAVSEFRKAAVHGDTIALTLLPKAK